MGTITNMLTFDNRFYVKSSAMASSLVEASTNVTSARASILFIEVDTRETPHPHRNESAVLSPNFFHRFFVRAGSRKCVSTPAALASVASAWTFPVERGVCMT